MKVLEQTIPVSLVPPPVAVSQKHPRGLYTLFFTEMWERFSYYGMRALLVLFMVDKVRGGMGWDDRTATAIYGLYTASVYLMSLPGGWLSDRFLGAQRAVWYGGMVIALGHFTLALPWVSSFYVGLVLVVIGSGTLKPNMSGLVAELYPEGGARRDAGFTIFYMGVNLGAALGPLICGWLATTYGWHYGFGAAAIGMVLGLVVFRFTRSALSHAGTKRTDDKRLSLMEKIILVAGLGGGALGALLVATGVVHISPVVVAKAMTYVIVTIAIVFFLYAFLGCGLDLGEKKRVAVILVLFLTSALFWAGFEQAGSSFNLFAERFTARQWDWAHFEIPAAWFQALGPVFIITFAPAFAALWVWLGRRNLNPSIPVKFAFGLLLLGGGFVVMAGASKLVAGGAKVLPVWLITTYLVHTFGELCLSPVGLSSVTKLAPRKLAGQMMGIWFLATSLGNLLAGLLAGEFKTEAIHEWQTLYLKIVILPAVAGLILLVFAKPIKRLMAGVK
jgi:proton-dependent oligopeptide transporter, POT family